MDGRFAAFMAISTLLIIAPGPDMALVLRNALRSGRRSACLTAFGVGSGILVWGIASVLGLAVLLDRSAVAFAIVKVAGAAYLLVLGVRALAGGRARPDTGPENAPCGSGRPHGGDHAALLQGLLGNLLNPKAGIIFVTVIPQFIRPGDGPVRLFAMLAVFEAILLGWLNLYGYLIVRAAEGPMGRRVRIMLNRLTGVALIGLGLRIATERR